MNKKLRQLLSIKVVFKNISSSTSLFVFSFYALVSLISLTSLIWVSVLTYSAVRHAKASNTDYELSVLSFYNDKAMINGSLKNTINLFTSTSEDKKKMVKYNSFLDLAEENNYLLMQAWSNNKNNFLDLNLNSKTFVKGATNSLDRYFEAKATNYLKRSENKLFYSYFNAGSHYSVRTRDIVVDIDQAWPFMDEHSENAVLTPQLKEEIKLSFFQFHEAGHRMSYELVMNNAATTNSSLASFLINSDETKNENITGNEKFKKDFKERYEGKAFYSNKELLNQYLLQHAEAQADIFALLFISKKYPELNKKNKIYFLAPLIEYRSHENTADKAHQTSSALELLKLKMEAKKIDITKNLSLEEINEISHSLAEESSFKLIDDEMLNNTLSVYEL